ncbi:SulP family sulfate permease [Paenibacillus taihuensis]|uniref:SulP family sulfate permease n=1 Tax=Paenibacillus taihuensis TaxID=1156355 RepID=A0A3D9R0Z1_9BACL|nr:sulfate permease [Paenibacillus taihuensis]REE67981.1 SulP family sulfate permease [Paenibacillus taihuensis]
MKGSGRFEGYRLASLRKDLIAGLIVGIIAIPLGMGFAIASGVKPEYGIYTTIVAGILISLFGGSKYLIGGPTGAFIPILFAIVLQYGYENLLIAGFMSGIILVIMGLCRLGELIKFIPRPVTIGFTAGIAVIIFSGQISNFIGLRGIVKHEYFLPNMNEIMLHLATANLYSIATASVCLMSLLITPMVLPKFPGSLVGIIVSTIVASLLFQGHVATIGSSFGAIPAGLPHLHIPNLSWGVITHLIQPALIIAMLGAIESLLSAVVADGMTGSRHNSNRELVAQGIANMIAPLFGGIPATGAIARTATNIKNGAVSPISGIIHGVVVLVVLVLFAPFASDIPLASIAPILMLVAWNMSERKHFMHILKSRTSDSIVLVATFMLTVLTDLTIAVGVGLALAVLIFVKRMSDDLAVAKVLPDRQEKHEKVRPYVVSKDHDCPQISVISVGGTLFFGSASLFEKLFLELLQQQPRIVILRLGSVTFMDTTGEANLARIVKQLERSGVMVLVTGLQRQPHRMLVRSGLYDHIGKPYFFRHTGEAITYAIDLLDRKKCLGCTHFAFRECTSLSNREAGSPS